MEQVLSVAVPVATSGVTYGYHRANSEDRIEGVLTSGAIAADPRCSCFEDHIGVAWVSSLVLWCRLLRPGESSVEVGEEAVRVRGESHCEYS